MINFQLQLVPDIPNSDITRPRDNHTICCAPAISMGTVMLKCSDITNTDI